MLSLNLWDYFHFYVSMSAIKGVKNMVFQKSLISHETNLMPLFLSFSLARTKNQRGIIKYPAVEGRQDQDEVRYV